MNAAIVETAIAIFFMNIASFFKRLCHSLTDRLHSLRFDWEMGPCITHKRADATIISLYNRYFSVNGIQCRTNGRRAAVVFLDAGTD